MAVSREMVAQVGRNRRLSMKNCIYYFFEERKKGGKEKFIHVIKFREILGKSSKWNWESVDSN